MYTYYICNIFLIYIISFLYPLYIPYSIRYSCIHYTLLLLLYIPRFLRDQPPPAALVRHLRDRPARDHVPTYYIPNLFNRLIYTIYMHVYDLYTYILTYIHTLLLLHNITFVYIYNTNNRPFKAF